MNWLQRLAQIKPMPLPVIYLPKGKVRPEQGFTVMDDLMTQETADAEKATHPDISFLGSGQSGVATDIGNKIVRKYTSDADEAANARVQMDLRRQHIVAVYDVQEIQNGIWAIDSEKVQPLSDEEAAAVTEIYHAITEENAIPGYDHITTEDPDIDPAVFDQVHDEYLRFVMQMSEDDYFTINDAWGDNMGRTEDGRMVLLDLGNAHIPVFQE